MRLDAWVPAFEVHERHAIEIDARADRVYSAVRGVDLSGSSFVRALFALRSLGSRKRRLGLSIDALLEIGFSMLEEAPPNEMVLGLVARPWRPSGGIVPVKREKFQAFDDAGYAKIGWSFEIAQRSAVGVTLSTETRIHCTDSASLRKFRWYWRLIGPFSAITRRAMLRSIKRSAES